MDETAQVARENLAFLKGIAQDQDPLPAEFGGQLIAPGVIFAACAFTVWAMLAGHLTPADAQSWLRWKISAVGLALYFPITFWLSWRGRAAAWGSSKRLFGATWGAMGAMSGVTLVSLALASAEMHAPFLLLWPSIALVLWGGSWAVIASARRELWQYGVAVICFVMAVWCATLIGDPKQWLMLGVALLVVMAAPGLFITLQARRA
jgi:hypothetical protein